MLRKPPRVIAIVVISNLPYFAAEIVSRVHNVGTVEGREIEHAQVVYKCFEAFAQGLAGDSVHRNAALTAAYRDGSVSVSEGQVGLDVGDALNNVFVRSS